MKGIVWGACFNNASSKLDQIMIRYQEYGVLPKEVKRSRNHYEITFENHDHWRALIANDSARGYACNLSYIDKNISQDYINCIVIPCTKAFPWQGFNYYDGGANEVTTD